MRTIFIILLFCFIPALCTAQLINDFRVNDDTGFVFQGYAKIGTDRFGNFVVVWRDLRSSVEEIYCQRFSKNAIPLGNNFLLSSYPNYVNSPSITIGKNGEFAVCWADTLVRMRVFDKEGTPVSPEIQVNYGKNPYALYPAISSDTSGNYIVVYDQYSYTWMLAKKHIHFQRFDPSGNKIGGEIRVNEDTLRWYHQNPAITIRNDGSFIIAWQRPHPVNGDFDIYMQMYDKYANKIGTNTKVSDDTSIYHQVKPWISSDDSGRFCIAFENQDDGSEHVKLQLYKSDGTRQGNNITVAAGDHSFFCMHKRKNGDIIVGYSTNYLNNFDTYCQRISAYGGFIGPPYFLSTQYPQNGKYYYDVKIFNDNVISVFAEHRYYNYYSDIFCNIRSYTKPDSIIITHNTISGQPLPDKNELFQNYPNPFNGKTNIKYSVKEIADIKIVVYDVNGKEVIILKNSNQNPGTYNIELNTDNLSSGIYYYSLFTDGKRVNTKRTVLIK